MTPRSAARHLGITASEAKRQQDEVSDLQLSELCCWQKILNVPLEELLQEPKNALSTPLLHRARLVRLMKSARSIEENAARENIRRMAKRMIDLLLEIMPELETIIAWHSVGQRRRLNELGRIVERQVSDDLFREWDD